MVKNYETSKERGIRMENEIKSRFGVNTMQFNDRDDPWKCYKEQARKRKEPPLDIHKNDRFINAKYMHECERVKTSIDSAP